MNYDFENNTLEECLNYWENPKDHNLSKNYNREHTQQRSRYLVGMFDKYNVDKNSNILEIGCNCGRNLNHLYNAAYKNLNGIEINSEALKNMKEFFPRLKANCINGNIEDNILFYKDNEFDVIYTMAVIQHLHIDSNWIFEHVSRICKKYLILIELDTRDYEKIFGSLGFTLIEKRNCTKIKGIEKYKFRIFEKKDK
jgi:SAM-dependent methyltransferase